MKTKWKTEVPVTLVIKVKIAVSKKKKLKPVLRKKKLKNFPTSFPLPPFPLLSDLSFASQHLLFRRACFAHSCVFATCGDYISIGPLFVSWSKFQRVEGEDSPHTARHCSAHQWGVQEFNSVLILISTWRWCQILRWRALSGKTAPSSLPFRCQCQVQVVNVLLTNQL